MRLSELLWADASRPLRRSPESQLGAGTPPGADDRALADDPAPGVDEPEAGRGLAGRLARLPAAHPSARPGPDWSDAARSDPDWSTGDWRAADSSTAVWRAAAWSTGDWAGRRPGGDQASEDAWWRGESDIWWRIPEWSAGERDYDDSGGMGYPGELADADEVTEAGCPGEFSRADDVGGADEADGTDEPDGQGDGSTGARPGRAPGTAGPGQSQRDGHWAEASGPRAGRDHESYRPWFSPDVSGDPWFAAGPEDQPDS